MIAVLIAVLVVGLLIIGLVLGTARDQDLSLHRMATVRAFYAAEAGTNMGIRELRLNTDADGDGGVGSISDDGSAGNDPLLGTARVYVTRSTTGTQTTLTSRGRGGNSARVISSVVDAATTGTAMIAYGRNGGSGTPRYRLFDGSTWGAETNCSAVGADPQWLVLRGSPIANQFALAVLDNDFDVEVQLYDGTSWGGVMQATNNAGDRTHRVMDLAYEQVSGHLLLVYRRPGTSNIAYRTYNGLSWSGESLYPMTAGNLVWLKLVPRADSDEMMLIASSDDWSNHSRAATWNGSSFSNQVSLSPLAGLGFLREHVDGAFEASSDHGMAIFMQFSVNPGYRTLSSATWSSIQNAPSVGSFPLWCRLAADPVSDEIAFAALDFNQDVNVNVWNGSSWGTDLQVESNSASYTRRGFDIAYENGGGQALVAYDENSSTLKYCVWDGFGWSTELSGPSGGSAPIQVVQAVTGIVPGQVFVTWTMDNAEIRNAVWSGSSLGAATVIGPASANKEYEAFMVATSGIGNAAPLVTMWSEVQP